MIRTHKKNRVCVAEKRRQAMESLPTEVFMRILASFKLKDLLRFLSLVCKNWRDTILFSKPFQCLHYRVCESQRCILYFPKEYTDVQDKGLVCMSMRVDEEERPLEVRNVVTNIGKIIPSPSPGFQPFDMIVDANLGHYTILATKSRDHSTVLTEVFDSRENAWKEAATLHWDAAFQSKLVGSVAMLNRTDDLLAVYDMEQDSWSITRIEFPDPAPTVSYNRLDSYTNVLDSWAHLMDADDMEQDGWSIARLGFPERAPFAYSILPCKGRIVLAALAYAKPHIKLWDLIIEDGVAKARLMTEIRDSTLAQLVTSPDVKTPFTEWQPLLAQTEDGMIDIVIDGGEIGRRCILLEYDLIRCSWQGGVIPVKDLAEKSDFVTLFSPSLFSP